MKKTETQMALAEIRSQIKAGVAVLKTNRATMHALLEQDKAERQMAKEARSAAKQKRAEVAAAKKAAQIAKAEARLAALKAKALGPVGHKATKAAKRPSKVTITKN